MLDTHCHLNDKAFADINQVVNDFLSSGVEKAICVAWDYDSSLKAIELSNEYESIYCVVGCHPDECE